MPSFLKPATRPLSEALKTYASSTGATEVERLARLARLAAYTTTKPK